MKMHLVACGIAGIVVLLACGKDDNSGSGRVGACDITSTESMDVRSCIEFSGLSDAQVDEAAAICRKDQAGVIKTWHADRNCSSSGRLGSCQENTGGIASTRFTYTTGSTERDTTVRAEAEQRCASDGGAWSASRGL